MKPFLKGKIVFLLFIISLYSNQTNDKLLENILVGKYNPDQIKYFSVVPEKYSLSKPIYINKESLDAFIKMADAAEKKGFKIFIISGVRNFAAQKSIWESKFNGSRLVEGKNLKESMSDEKKRALKILEFSSMPGTSRHHWGTDIDIGFDRKNASKMLTNEIYASGEGKKFYDWMIVNSVKYGFCQPYKNHPEERKNESRRGYQEEKWHWSYKPVASEYLKLYIKNSRNFLPSGFDGSSASGSLYMEYVQNIHQECL